MIYRNAAYIIGILALILVIYIGINVSRPCSNGAIIYISNKQAENLRVQVLSDHQEVVLHEQSILGHSKVSNIRLYFKGGSAYVIKLYDPSNGNLLLQDGPFGYADTPFITYSYFTIDDKILYEEKKEANAFKELFLMGNNAVSCADDYLLESK